MTNMITPNSPDPIQTTATDNPAVPSLDSIAQKMAAMREHTERNLLRATEQTATGTQEPVAHESVEPEVADAEDTEYASDDLETDAQSEETVSEESTNSSADDLIDFIEFAETNPSAKFKFMKNKFNLVKIKIKWTQSTKTISQGRTVTVTVSMYTKPPQFCKVRFLISKGNHQRFGVG